MMGRTRLLIAAGVTTAALAITIPAVALASDGDDHPGDRPGPDPGLGLVLQDKLCTLSDEELEQRLEEAENRLREADAFSDDWLHRRADDARAKGHDRFAKRLDNLADRDGPRAQHLVERRKDALLDKLEDGTFGDRIREAHEKCDA